MRILVVILFFSFFSGQAQLDSLSERIQVYQLPQIVFHFDKADLLKNESVNSEDSLNYLYEVLVHNPTFIIEVRNHSDCRASVKYGRNLSLRRAQACVNYLIEKGIDAKRLHPKGMRESEPLPGLSCEEISKMKTNSEKEQAHQKNRRTDFKVVSWDFIE